MFVSWLLAQLGLPFFEPGPPPRRPKREPTDRRRRVHRRHRRQRRALGAVALANDRRQREHLQSVVPGLLERWEPRLGVAASEWRIKRMRTRWGSCNVDARRIWLNVELARKTPECLEYVVVHELVHLLEPSHNARFHALMTQYLPDWKERRERLNASARSRSASSAEQDALELC